jgi:hypothetical protein
MRRFELAAERRGGGVGSGVTGTEQTLESAPHFYPPMFDALYVTYMCKQAMASAWPDDTTTTLGQPLQTNLSRDEPLKNSRGFIKWSAHRHFV